MTRPFLVARFCSDPNPHRPHPWPLSDPDEDARWFCRGVFAVGAIDDFTAGALSVEES